MCIDAKRNELKLRGSETFDMREAELRSSGAEDILLPKTYKHWSLCGRSRHSFTTTTELSHYQALRRPT